MTKSKTDPKFKTHFNMKAWGEGYEVNTLPSLTVPDQTMSIPEILRRYAIGLPLGGQRVPLYEGEEDILEGRDPRTLDISEKHDLVNAVSDELYKLKVKQDKAKQARKRKSESSGEQNDPGASGFREARAKHPPLPDPGAAPAAPGAGAGV